jgi:geranylgeranyl diphosphate synthase type I
VTEDDYLSMVRRKTATLIGAAAGLGALVGGADSDTVQAWNTVGINLGMAFQIQDDLIGIWGDPHTTGKPGSGDLQRRKVTLPIIRALCHPEFGPALGRIYSQETITDADVQRMLDILQRTSVRLEMEALIRHMARATHDALEAIPEPIHPVALQARQQIAALITSLLPLARRPA